MFSKVPDRYIKNNFASVMHKNKSRIVHDELDKMPQVEFQATKFKNFVKSQRGGCGITTWAGALGCEHDGPCKVKMSWISH